MNCARVRLYPPLPRLFTFAFTSEPDLFVTVISATWLRVAAHAWRSKTFEEYVRSRALFDYSQRRLRSDNEAGNIRERSFLRCSQCALGQYVPRAKANRRRIWCGWWDRRPSRSLEEEILVRSAPYRLELDGLELSGKMTMGRFLT